MPDVEFKENKQLIVELCNDRYNGAILRFFARHPYARFDKQVLISGIGLKDTRHIELALDNLAGQKLLETKSGHEAPLYWLTRREPLQSAIKSALAPRIQTGDTREHLSMMQLIMPLTPCPVMASPAE